MYSELLSITQIRELYVFLLSVDKTSYKEITDVFGIVHAYTIRKYFDLIEELYNVSIVTDAGRYGGTKIYKRGGNVRLGKEEERALMALLEGDYKLTPKMKKSLYSILYRLGGSEETEEFLKKIRPTVFKNL
ncbi:hypothetical protein SAMN04487934_1297 [Eubacterium ruminantium]|nr:hypothetical protein SAMN04487934_1297 [Eubacterium ruminantium]